MSEELFKANKNRPGEAAALCCQSSVRLQRAMSGTSPQLQLAEDKEEKVKAVKSRQALEAKQGLTTGRAACGLYRDLDDKASEANCLNLAPRPRKSIQNPCFCKGNRRENQLKIAQTKLKSI